MTRPRKPARRRVAATRRPARRVRKPAAAPARPRARAAPATPRARATRGPAAARAPGTVTQAEYARLRGLSRAAVSKAVADGRIPVDAQGRIDPAAADSAWRANTDPGRPSSRIPGVAPAAAPPVDLNSTAQAAAEAAAQGNMELPSGVTLNDARALREWNQAVKLFVERRRLTDELVEAKLVEDAAFRAARTARDRIMALPDRLDATVAALYGVAVAEVRRLLEAECRRICEELAAAMLQDPDAEDDQPAPEAAAS